MARHSTSSLSIELLEDRRFLAASAILNRDTGQLQINGTSQAEIITMDAVTTYVQVGHAQVAQNNLVVNVSNPPTLPSVSNVPKSAPASGLAAVAKPVQFSFRLSDVKTIDVQANDGNDTIKNNTVIPMTAHGGRGDDVIQGGSGKDTLWGDQDVDTLSGGSDDDVLHGGLGDDKLAGNSGNDKLWGDEGRDTIDGGVGLDRILKLQDSGPLDVQIQDNFAGDAFIFFENGVQHPASVNDGGAVMYSAGTFQPKELEQIDKALDILFSRTHNNALLKQADGGALTFVRQGKPIYNLAQLTAIAVNAPQGIDNPTFTGWNDGDKISFVDETFSYGEDSALGTVIHEIGHNWDESTENPLVVPFRGLSGWVDTNPNSWAYTKTGSDAHPFWYLTQAKFASSYAKTNPLEDFAESFSAYFMNRSGRTFNMGYDRGAAAIPDKISMLDIFFNSLGS